MGKGMGDGEWGGGKEGVGKGMGDGEWGSVGIRSGMGMGGGGKDGGRSKSLFTPFIYGGGDGGVGDGVRVEAGKGRGWGTE